MNLWQQKRELKAKIFRETVIATTLLVGFGIVSAPAAAGGNGNNGNGNMGGAPVPEVNALLGLALAGGAVAFLRRRKHNKANAET